MSADDFAASDRGPGPSDPIAAASGPRGRTGHPGEEGGVARSGRALPLITGIAAALFVLISAVDLLQMLVGLTFTANDIGYVAWGYSSGPRLALGFPINALQTLLWAVVSGVLLVGGVLCIGRRRGLAAVAGILAVLAVALPTVLHLQLMVLVQWMSVSYSPSARLAVTLYPGATIAAGMVSALIAAVLLLIAAGRRSPVVGPRPSAALGLVGAVILLAESVLSLIQVLASHFSWWAVMWSGLVGHRPLGVAAIVTVLLVSVLAGGIGAGLLLGSRLRLVRAGGALVLAAVTVRLLSQLAYLGMLPWVRERIIFYLDMWLIYGVEQAVTITVLVLALAGTLLAAAGLLVGAAGSSRKGTPITPQPFGPSDSADRPRR